MRLGALLLSLGAVAASQSVPAPRYEWPGECPEGCRYNTAWTIARDTAAWPEPHPAPEWKPTGPPLFTIAAGESVRAVTGTVYTLESGVARMRDDFATDASYASLSASHRRVISFRAGEQVELLLRRTAGIWRILRDGRAIDANLYAVMERDACERAGPRCAGTIEKQPVTRWWVMVMTAAKQAGWIEQPPGR
jgi:hypothetical protein